MAEEIVIKLSVPTQGGVVKKEYRIQLQEKTCNILCRKEDFALMVMLKRGLKPSN